jgi:rfaE bifunctional protein kinase chain/domain/rfaE bifunctional protein nucleotidyltransferase chain/domain
MKVIINQKVKRITSLVKITQKLKKEGKKIILCHGIFDLIHPGHIRFFEKARTLGDILIVSVTADKFVNKGLGRPIFNENLRAEVLSSISLIDYVLIVKSINAVDTIGKLQPDYFVKGPDYKKQNSSREISENLNIEEKALKVYGGQLLFTDDKVVYSSSHLIDDYIDVYPKATKKYLDNLKNKYKTIDILKKLENLKKIKMLIIGEAIIDQYFYCTPLGKSSKEPVMVHQYDSHESFAGGVLATANHAESLSHNITLVTLLGKKQSFKSFILKKLRSSIKPVFFYQPNESTIIKRRFVDKNTKQKLFQVSYLKDDFLLPEKKEKEIIDYLNSEIGKFDMIIVNDFGHGMITKKMTRLICRKAKYLTLNVQSNSANYGFNVITKYPRADYVCIDNQEIRLATHDKFSNLEPMMKKIYRKMKCKFMIVTRGPKGSLAYSQKNGFTISPALSDRIVDRVGAGDALFAITSPCVYAGMSDDLVAFMGNIAGALKVQIVGNKKQIEFADLEKYLFRLLK